jgi:hypothetical protein
MAEAEVFDSKSFQPFDGGRGARLSVTSSSSRVEVPGTQPGQFRKVLVQNRGAYPAYIKIGQSDVVATTSSMLVFPGVPYVLTVPSGLLTNGMYVAGITDSGETTTLVITSGDGS